MLLIASCPITGVVGTTSSRPTCLLLTKHRQNTIKCSNFCYACTKIWKIKFTQHRVKYFDR